MVTVSYTHLCGADNHAQRGKEGAGGIRFERLDAEIEGFTQKHA